MLPWQDAVEESELDHRVDHSVDAAWRDEQLAGLSAAETRRDRQVPVRHIGDVERPVLLGGLTGEAFAEPKLLVLRIGRHRIAGDATEASVRVSHKRDTGVGVQVARQKRQRVVAERFEPLFPLEAGGQSHLAVANPRLRFTRVKIARHDDRGEAEQDRQHACTTPGRPGRQRDRALEVALLRIEGGALADLGFVDQRADPVHDHLAAVGAHHLEGGRRIAGAAKGDRFPKLVHFLPGQLFDGFGGRASRGALRQGPQPADLGRKGRAGFGERLDVAFLSGQQIAPLSGFGVRQARLHHFELLNHLERIGNTGRRDFSRAESLPGDERNQRNRHNRDDQAYERRRG